MKSHYLWLAAILLLTSCNVGTRTPVQRGIYHWKTTYNPTNWEKQWMKDHEVGRLYIKLFDVDAGQKHSFPDWKMVPVATTQFKQKLPDDVEIVPVVYITTDAIHALVDVDDYYSSTSTYANLIVKRIDDMMKENWNGTLREVQLDCDWTQQTEHAYFTLANMIKKLLNERGITLSGTLRLHQLREVEHPTEDEYANKDSIPFDRSLLMCYNTGSLYDRDIENSILDFDDVKPYLNQYKNDLLPRTDVAYPVYGWGVEYDKKGSFKQLINSHNMPKQSNDSVRVEWGRPSEIAQVKAALPTLDTCHTIILFHLDSLNLSKYSYEDIEALYSR